MAIGSKVCEAIRKLEQIKKHSLSERVLSNCEVVLVNDFC